MLNRIAKKWRADDGQVRGIAVWLATALAAAVFGADPLGCAAVAAAGLAASLAGRRARPALLLPVAVGAVAGVDVLPWAIAGAALHLRTPPETVGPHLDGELQRQLMRSRRRDERADVLVMRAGELARAVREELVRSLRATDGLELVTDESSCELRAVLDGDDIDRSAVEQRVLAAAGPAAEIRFGWSSFPTNGVTLEALLDAARRDLSTATVTHVEPVAVPLAGRTTPLSVEGNL